MNDNEECDHEHDGFYVAEPPSWKFSLWDVAGISLHTAGGVLNVLGQGFVLMAQECSASANRSRKTWDLRQAERKDAEAREAMAADLEHIVDLNRTHGGDS